MIRSFRSADTATLFRGERVARFVNIEAVARRKLRMLDAAARLEDLAIFPGNRLKALAGDRKGQYAIRINDQFRLCFVWSGSDADRVEIVDYH